MNLVDHPELDRARQTLRSHQPTPGPGVRTRVAARLFEAPPPRRLGFAWGLAGAVTLAAAVLFFVKMPEPLPVPRLIEGLARVQDAATPLGHTEQVPTARPLQVDRAARFDLGGATIVATSDSRFSLTSRGGRVESVELAEGEVRAEVAPLTGDDRFFIVTAHARIEVVGTVFSVARKPGATTVRVESGVVRVTPLFGGGVRILRAGEETTVTAPRAEIAPPPAVEPAPRRSPVPAIRVRPRRRPAPATAPVPAVPVADDRADSEDPELATPPIPETYAHQATLREARQALGEDPDAAATLATRVLATAPAPEVEVQALAVLADAHRRRMRWDDAIRTYRRVALHADSRPYGEEALLQLAMLHDLQGDASRALDQLDHADRRYGAGNLIPERKALQARLLVRGGRAARAAGVLEALGPPGTSLELHRARLEVARALLPTDPERARRLVEPVAAADVPGALRSAARLLLQQADEAR